MHKGWTYGAVVMTAVFLGMGLLWMVAPGLAASQLKMPLLEGAALSTQLGDLASFFLTLGACIGLAIITRRSLLLSPAMMLLGFAALGRLLAWGVHGASLALDMVLVEVAVASFLFVLQRRMKAAGA